MTDSEPDLRDPDMRVFEWFGKNSNGESNYHYHCHERDVELYRQVANRLCGDTAYWAELIRAHNWRFSIVGCNCLLAIRRSEFFADLCYRFRAGSWVSPQIACTLGLLHGSAARPFFESFLEDPMMRNQTKTAVSAHRVLLRLGVQPAHDIPIDEAWQSIKNTNERAIAAIKYNETMIAAGVVSSFWDFWSKKV